MNKLFFLLISLFVAFQLNAQTRTASVSGNWSNTATWGGLSVPTSANAVVINTGIIVTVDVDAACASITVNAPAVNNGITISGTFSLVVTGAVTMNLPSAGTVTSTIAVGAGTLTAASIAIPGSTTAGRYCTVSVSIGTINVSGNITFSGTAAQARLTFTGAGTLNIGGALSTGGTFAASTGSVNFNGANQTVPAYTYNNVTLSGSGTVTVSATAIGGNLTFAGSVSASWTSGITVVDLTLSGTASVTLGTTGNNYAATGNLSVGSGTSLTVLRQFNVGGTSSITGSINFGSTSTSVRIMTFTGDVTLNSGAVWDETNGGANTVLDTYTFGGSLTNNATTFTPLAGLHTFSGTGTISGSTATVAPNLTISGTITNTGTLTVSTLLTISGTLDNSGGTLTPGTVTVNYAGAVQTVVPGTYNNLTLSGSGVKTTTGVTVNGVLSMEGTATASVALTYGASATLQYNTTTSRNPGVEWVDPFTGSGGIIIENTGTITLNSTKDISLLTIQANGVFNDGGFAISTATTLNLTSGTYFCGLAEFPWGTANITAGTTVNYNSSGSQTIAALNYGNLTSSSTGARILPGTGTVGIANAFTPGTNSYTTTGSAINFNGAAQTVSAFTAYNDVTLSGSGAKTMSATTIGHNLTISGTCTVTLATGFSVGGSLNMNTSSGTGVTLGSGTTITVTGDVTGTGTLTTGNTLSARTINFGGNWSHSGTSTGTLLVAVANGTGDQSISAVISTGPGSLTINKSSGKTTISAQTFASLTVTAGAVTLGGAVTVNTALTLTSGIVTTTSTNILILGNAATITAGSSASYINGPLDRNYTSTGAKVAVFPIGKDGTFRSVTLNLTESAVTSTNYIAEMFNGSPVVNNMPGTLDAVSNIRYFVISTTGGSAFTAGTVLLNYGADDGVITAADVRVAQGLAAGGGTWVDLAGTGTGAPTGTITSTTNFTSLANTVFVLADRIGGSNPLPIELSSFTSIVKGRDVNLNWETKTEINSNSFVIERTKTGDMVTLLNWTPVQSVKASFSSNTPKQYSFTDKNVQAGKYQYRLKMIDNDGNFTYSSIAEASVTIPLAFDLSQNYPNPFNPSTKINYTLPADSRVTLEVFNLIGERVAQIVDAQQSAGYYTVNFGSAPVKNITSGIYIYKLIAVDNTGKKFSSIKKMMLLK